MPINKERLTEVVRALRLTYDTLNAIESKVSDATSTTPENAADQLYNLNITVHDMITRLPHDIATILGREETWNKLTYNKNEYAKSRLKIQRYLEKQHFGQTTEHRGSNIELTDLAPAKHSNTEPIAITIPKKSEAQLDTERRAAMAQALGEKTEIFDRSQDKGPSVQDIPNRTETETTVKIEGKDVIHVIHKDPETLEDLPSQDTSDLFK